MPVLALSQLRRINSKEEPQLSDLRESGAIEQDADIVMFIHRPDVAATEEEIKSGKVVKDMADLIIAKHRNGEMGRVKLRFRGDQVRYVNPPPGFVPEDTAPPQETEENEDYFSEAVESFMPDGTDRTEFDDEDLPFDTEDVE